MHRGRTCSGSGKPAAPAEGGDSSPLAGHSRSSCTPRTGNQTGSRIIRFVSWPPADWA